MTKISITIILCFITVSSILSQCNDQVRLSSQAEVDAFRIKYGNCKKLLWLVLDGRESPIYNLDSLYALEEVPFLTLAYLDSLKPDACFKNLKISQELSNYSFSRNNLFPNLEKVQILYHTFPDSSQDLSIYKKINYIKSSLFLRGNGSYKGLGNYTTSADFNISMKGCSIPNDLLDILPDDISKLESLSFSFCKNISTNGCEKIKEISSLNLNSSSDCDLSGISNITKLNTLNVINIDPEEIKLEKFQLIDTLRDVYFYRNKGLYNLNQILPNLKVIMEMLVFEGNMDLEAINMLSDFPLPLAKKNPKYLSPALLPYRIIIKDNPLLYHCDIDFICRALATYPDSVLISNNSPDCNKDDLLRQCTSATEEVGTFPDIRLYPNPSSGTIHLIAPASISAVRVTNMTGSLIYQASDSRDEIDISSWPPGAYLMTITLNDGTRTVKKLIRND